MARIQLGRPSAAPSKLSPSPPPQPPVAPPPAAQLEAPPPQAAAPQPQPLAASESVPASAVESLSPGNGARTFRTSLDSSALHRELEELIASHAADLSDDGGLHFSESQRREILQLLGSVDPDSIVQHIRNLVTARINLPSSEPLTLTFSAQQLERVGFRCSAGESLQGKLQEFCDYGVNLETGLR